MQTSPQVPSRTSSVGQARMTSAQLPGSGTSGGPTVTSGMFRRSSFAIATRSSSQPGRGNGSNACGWRSGGIRSFYSRLGWRDSGAIMYAAETEAGPFAVPSHRYEVDLTDPVPGDRAGH